ncbi:MAG: type II toxin-antitoxin system HicB family antitoxin [Methanosarcinales archaeon]|nr:MAG: type II toxin-antitoxin system HicB family antitoxin [Methanosarcinales archaeon]
MQRYRISVVIEKDVDGYFAFCPELQGCYTQGDSYEEVLENIRDAIRIHIEDRRGDKEDHVHSAHGLILASVQQPP